MKKNQIYILTILSLCVFFGGYYKKYIGTGIRADIFIFYDYPNGGRLLSNIFNDISQMITVSFILGLWYYFENKLSKKSAILPFLIISIVDLLDYFLFYKQMSVFKLPLLIFLIFLFNIKWKSKKQ